MRRPRGGLIGAAALALVLVGSGGESAVWPGPDPAPASADRGARRPAPADLQPMNPAARPPESAPAPSESGPDPSPDATQAASPAAPGEAGAPADDISDLPVEEVPVPAGVTEKPALAVLLTGDGGWAKLVKALSAGIAKRGYPVAALNSLKYYWEAKTPEQSGADLARLIEHYLAAWKKDRLILVGYSLGADVLPFMANRMDPALLDKADLIAIVSPDRTATFEFHMSDWLHMKAREPEYPILPEISRLKGRPLVCIRGEEETESLCTELPPGEGEAVTLAGGHHLGGNYDAIVEAILSRLKP